MNVGDERSVSCWMDVTPVIDAPFDQVIEVVQGLLKRANLLVVPAAQQEAAHVPSPGVGDH